MKKKLLKPPENDREILILPEVRDFLSRVNAKSKVGVCHQPYLFNPGISAKFVFLESLPTGKKKIIFHDTDSTRIGAMIPLAGGWTKPASFINDERIMSEYPMPDEKRLRDFLFFLESELKKAFPRDEKGVFSTFFRFKEILLSNSRKKFLKETLSETFMEFYGIAGKYSFLTDHFKGKEFKDFMLKIYKGGKRFRRIFNEALDEYKKEYRFRFKNYPFPKLKEGELPFWVIKDGKRFRCFEKDINESDIKKLKVFPKASTLTVFLRLKSLDLFIHGVGGANYEWVADRVIERFFKRKPPLFAVVSGTFLIEGYKEREFPYFLFDPEEIKERVKTLF